MDGTVIVTVAGELDLTTEPYDFGRIDDLLNGETKAVVLDLHAVTFIDSAGLLALVAARDHLLQQGQKARFANPPHGVTRLTKILGLDLNDDSILEII